MNEVVHTGEVRVAAPPDVAFGLFTPEGERRWVAGWNPHWLYPAEGALTPGAVFRTDHGGEETTWVVLDADPPDRRVRYLRITPGSRMGTVEVRCLPAGSGTTARITYRMTALSDAGREVLENLSSDRYAEMMASWEHAIATILQS